MRNQLLLAFLAFPFVLAPITQHVPLGRDQWSAYVNVDALTLPNGTVSYIVVEPGTGRRRYYRGRLSGFGHRVLPINVRTPGTYQVFVTVEDGTQAYGAPATIQVGE
jgi:hypothetical protein